MIGPTVTADRLPTDRAEARRARFGRPAALAVTVLLLMVIGGGPAMAAMTTPAPRAQPAGTGLSVRAAEPFGDYINRLSFDVTAIDPALVTATSSGTLTITGTMSNSGPEGLTELAYRFQRGTKLTSDGDVRRQLAQPDEPNEQIQPTFTPIADPVPAGGSIPFSFTTSITDRDGLAITAPGVYPLMVNVNGAVMLADGPLEARIGELHLLLTVMGVPGASPASPTVGTGTPSPVNFVWPVVDRPHLGVGGVFLDEDLLAAISPGGRLSTLLDGLTDPTAGLLPAGSITVVLDPELLDELDRMTSAYRVAGPGGPQPSVADILQAVQAAAGTAGTGSTAVPTSPTTNSPTTDSPVATAPPATPPTATANANVTANPNAAAIGTAAATPTAIPLDPGSTDIPGTVAGTGQAAAASFLGRLRDVVARYPVLLLPYADPDVVAMVRADLNPEVGAAVRHGNEVALRVLGQNLGGGTTAAAPAPPSTSMAYPINGAVDADTLAALRDDGLVTALLSENSVDPSDFRAGAAQVGTPDGATPSGSEKPMQAAIAQPDVLGGVDTLIDQGKQSGWAMRVNALTGVLAQGSLDGAATPAVFTPDRRWSPDAPGLKVLTDLLSTLGASQVIAGVGLTDLANSGTANAVPAYPDTARDQELPVDYLDRLRADRANVLSLRQTLSTTTQATDPGLVLDPLDLALDSAGSTAFRDTPEVGTANLTTVESTAAGIRDGVEISSAGSSYTLASTTSPLVLTVQNNLPYDVPVRVEITGGERVGLSVSDPEVQVVPAGRSQQVKIPAEVSRSGQFQVDAQLVGPDGTIWGQPVQLSVESTAYGALTVIIIAVAGGVLLLMIVLRIVQRLRGKPDQTPGLEVRPTDVDPADPVRPSHLPTPPTDLLAEEPIPGSRSNDPAEQVGTDRS